MSHSLMNYFRRAQNELSTTNSAFQKYFIRITRPTIYFSSAFSRRCRVRPSPVSSNPNSVQVLQSRFQVLPGRTHVMCVPEYFVNMLTTSQQWYELEQYKKIFAVL